METILLKVLALGVASAMSPGLLAITLALLAGNKDPLKRVLGLLAGGLLTALVILLASYFSGSNWNSVGESATHANFLDLGLGLVLLFFGAYPLLVKEKERKFGGLRKPSAHPFFRWLALGFILNITNLDAVVFLFTSLNEVFQESIAFWYETVLVLVAFAFFTCPVFLPLLVYLRYPKTADKVLAPVGLCMKKYGQAIVSLMFIGFGLILIHHGLFP